MEPLTGFNNEFIIAMHATLTSPNSLDVAAAAFDAASGSTRARLAVAMTAAARARMTEIE